MGYAESGSHSGLRAAIERLIIVPGGGRGGRGGRGGGVAHVVNSVRGVFLKRSVQHKNKYIFFRFFWISNTVQVLHDMYHGQALVHCIASVIPVLHTCRSLFSVDGGVFFLGWHLIVIQRHCFCGTYMTLYHTL